MFLKRYIQKFANFGTESWESRIIDVCKQYNIEKYISTNRDPRFAIWQNPINPPNRIITCQFSAKSRSLMNVAWIMFNTSSCSIDRSINRSRRNERTTWCEQIRSALWSINQSKRSNVRNELSGFIGL